MATIAYIRVSTDEQAQSGLGLEAQLAAIGKAVGAPDTIYRDEAISGSNTQRPGLLAALESLRQGDVLVVAKRDRLARDIFFSLWVEKEAKKRGGRIVSAAGEGTEAEDPASVLMRHMVDAFAEYERNIIADRTAAALAQKRARGEKTGGIVPYGYSVPVAAGADVSTPKRLMQNKGEMATLDLIQDLRREGHTLRGIAAELERRAIPTKTGKAHWQAKTVSNLLKHERC
jgi:DNA invertase Pin-like site-specific DNA recombinase